MTSDLTSFAARLRGFIGRTHFHAESSWSLLTSAATDREFNDLALELFALQFAHNAAYRRLCEARGATPATVEHWSRIPAVPATTFKELELTCIPPDERTTVFRSSGTTGQQPSRHFHCAESLALYEASLWPWFKKHLLSGLPGGARHSVRAVGMEFDTSNRSRRAGDCPPYQIAADEPLQLLMLTPPRTAAPHSSLVHMFETVRQRVAPNEAMFVGETGSDGAWTVNIPRAEAVLQSAHATGQPVVLLGTAFNFVHLLDALVSKELRFPLPAGSRVMETGGYKGRSRELSKTGLHTLIEDRLGVPPSHIVCEYGMSELSSQAYDGVAVTTRNPQPATRQFHFPPWCRVQVISPETGQGVGDGETGLLRLFDLANAFSVLAVQTEDLAIRRGDGFELIGRAVAAEPRGCSLMTT